MNSLATSTEEGTSDVSAAEETSRFFFNPFISEAAPMRSSRKSLEIASVTTIRFLIKFVCARVVMGSPTELHGRLPLHLVHWSTESALSVLDA